MIALVLILVNYNIRKNEEDITEEIEYEEVSEEIIEEKERIFVYVAGEVKNPGVIQLEEGARVDEAVNKAGGITEMANLTNINLAKVVEDGEKIYISNQNEEIILEENQKSSVKININKASISELQSLNGLGPAMAQKIIEYRKSNGPFKSLDELKNVSGIGDNKFKELESQITI